MASSFTNIKISKLFQYIIIGLTFAIYLSSSVFGQLSGNKFIGPTGDYPTITDAVNALYSNTPNINGPVVFAIEDGTYDEQIILTSPITGSSAVNTVTFVSKSLNPAAVNIKPSFGSVVVDIQSAKNLIFQDLTFTANNLGRVIRSIGTEGYLTFTNNIFEGSSNIGAFIPEEQNIIEIASLSGGSLNNVIFNLNTINSGNNGIVLSSEVVGQNLDITNNTFSTISSAIEIFNFDAPNIINNTIINNSSGFAIQLNTLSNLFLVEGNKISTTTDLGSGINLINSTGTSILRGTIVNNFIQAASIGFKVESSSNIDIYHNTINIENTPLTSNIASSAFESTTDNINIINNIFNNERNGFAVIRPSETNTTSDYNVYYSLGDNLGKYNNIPEASLNDFQTASGSDANSKFAEVSFTSLSDLHLAFSSKTIFGSAITSVVDDIDGESRNNPPIIGADDYKPTALNGNYFIGTSGDFTSVKEAAHNLYLHGIDGPVNFNILDGQYNEQFTFDEPIPGADQTNQVTFQSESSNPNLVEITYSASNTKDNYVFRIDEAQYLKFKNLTFTAGGTDYAVVASILNTMGNLEFTGNIINGYQLNAQHDFSYRQNLIFCKYSALSNTIFEDNVFNEGSGGIILVINPGLFSLNLQIINNTFNTFETSIYLVHANAPLIKQNTIVTENETAVNLFNCDNDFIIEKNKVSGPTGISVSFSDGTNQLKGIVKNNFVHAVETGININGNNYTNIYFNTVNIDDPQSTKNVSSKAINIGNSASSKIDISNNMLINSDQGYALVDELGQLTDSDYNNLFSESSDLISWNGINYTDLSSYNSATQLEDNSFSESVTFNSSTDLHILSASPGLLGTQIATITDDIDGDTRSTPPYIGADEYMPSPLNGPYTVGASGDFLTINEAVTYMYFVGIDGAVTFNILSGTYNEQVDIDGPITGISATNTVTFQSSTGNSADVTINYQATGAADNYVFRLNNLEYITLQKLTIQALGTVYSHTIKLSNLNGEINIKENILNGYTNAQAGISQSVIICDDEGGFSLCKIENNTITGGSRGIHLDAGSPTGNLLISGNNIQTNHKGIYISDVGTPEIIQNTIVSSDDAILIENSYSPQIKQNIITNTGNEYSIFLFNCDNNILVEKNKINSTSSGAKGIFLNGCDGGSGSLSNNLVNNFIQCYDYGIGIAASSWINLYHNSVNIEDNPVTISGTTRAFHLESGTNLDISNNIFSNNRGGYAIDGKDYSSTNVYFDFNNLYSSGSILAHWNFTPCTTLTDFQTESGTNSNSFNVNPNFASISDLHVNAQHIDDGGKQLAVLNPLLIQTDIDGESRNLTSPSIGADEFVFSNSVSINIKLFLEGPFNGTDMNATLEVDPNSPYSEDPETLISIPIIPGNEVVDWVLVQLRDKTDESIILQSQSAFVLEDGSVVELDGSSPVSFAFPADSYYISVKHRNHLAVMSNTSIPIN